jgi:hypothetical protein
MKMQEKDQSCWERIERRQVILSRLMTEKDEKTKIKSNFLFKEQQVFISKNSNKKCVKVLINTLKLLATKNF